MSASSSVVTPEQIEAFRKDGAVCLRGLFAAAQIELLRTGIDANLARPSARAKVASQPGDPGHFIEDFCSWQENEAYRRFIFESALGTAAAQIMGSTVARLYHDHMLTKEPGTRQRTPWHHDQPYYNVAGNMNCSFWIPVDPVARESTLEFVAGSHIGPWRMPRTFLDAQARWFPEGSLTEIPDIDNEPDKHRILGWSLEPGDAVCFHMLTLHASGPVAANRRRRVFSVRVLGDDMVFAPRNWTTSPEFPGLEAHLSAGSPMDHPLFPILWQRDPA